MDIHRKHLDDFEEFCDFDERLDTNVMIGDDEVQETVPNPQFSWRRALIIRAADNVKRALENNDAQIQYKKGELIFDNQTNKFGRVKEFRQGFLNVSMLDGSELIRRSQDPLNYIKSNRHKLTITEMAGELSLKESEVVFLLNQIESTIEPKMSVVSKKVQTLAAVDKAPVANKIMPQKIASRLPKLKANLSVKPAAKKHKKVTKEKAFSSATFTKLLPKGATTDPIMDPNGYIKQNFMMLDNRELSIATGLSEHTIRRKLGEWGLKRK